MGVLFGEFYKSRNVEFADLKGISVVPVFNVDTGVQNFVFAAVLITSRICQPNIVASLSQDKRLSFLLDVSDPAAGRVNQSVNH